MNRKMTATAALVAGLALTLTPAVAMAATPTDAVINHHNERRLDQQSRPRRLSITRLTAWSTNSREPSLERMLATPSAS